MQFNLTWGKVLSGEKSQTRRIVKPGQTGTHNLAGSFAYVSENNGSFRYVYRVGMDYAVQPGRTAKGIARIRITDIRFEDVRNISREDVTAEGFESWKLFFDTWTLMHDKTAYTVYSRGDCIGTPGCRNYLWSRPAERYTAWVLTFCLVKD